MSDSRLVDFLRAEMARRGVGARKLAVDAGLNPEAVRNILHRKSRTPRPDTLKALAAYLDVTVDFLVGANMEEDHAAGGKNSLGLPARKPGLREWLEIQRAWNGASPEARKVMTYLARTIAQAEGISLDKPPSED